MAEFLFEVLFVDVRLVLPCLLVPGLRVFVAPVMYLLQELAILFGLYGELLSLFSIRVDACPPRRWLQLLDGLAV